MHGVTHTLQEIRHRGVPGFEVEVVCTDAIADRRLGAVADVEIPFYAGLKVGVPSLPAIVEALAEGRYDLVHLCTPGPAGVAALLTARVMDLPVLGSYHTELAAYAGLRCGRPDAGGRRPGGDAAFYGQCSVVLSPSEATRRGAGGLGIAAERIGRWDRGVDLARFSPDRRAPTPSGDGINVLYAGRLTREKGADLLADAFLAARERDPRLHLVLAGGGPEEELLRARLGEHATFLGWLEGDALADAYASADVFLFASRTDTFGQVLLEAQASAGCRSSPSPRAGRARSSTTASPGCCARPTRRRWPTRSSRWRPTPLHARAPGGRGARRGRASARGSARWSGWPTATAARWATGLPRERGPSCRLSWRS